MKIIINKGLDEEQLKRMEELFGTHPELLEGRELEIENNQIVKELVKWGIAERIENVHSNDDINNSPEIKKDDIEPERQKEDSHANESESDIPKDEDEEEKREEHEPQNEEQQKVVAERREIIEKIINASSFSAKDKMLLISAYCRNDELYWHFDSYNFLQGTSAEKISGIDNVNNIHRLIHGAVEANNDIGEAELDDTSIKVQVPPDIDNDELSDSEKAVAKDRIAQEIKRMVNEALYSNESPKKILVNIRNIEAWANNNREALAGSLASSASEEAIKDYIENVGKGEIREALKTAKEMTGDVQVSFEGVDFSNPSERKRAIELLSEVTDGAPGDAINSVKMNVAIDDKTDIKEAAKAMQELEACGVSVDVNVDANGDKELEKEAEQELDATSEEKVVSDVVKTGMAIAMGATAIDSLGLDEKEHEDDEHGPEIDFVPPIS